MWQKSQATLPLFPAQEFPGWGEAVITGEADWGQVRCGGCESFTSWWATWKVFATLYLDETWVNQNYTVSKCWVDTTSEKATGVKVPTGKGCRLIILHAGTKHGFVPNAALVFQAKNDGDYHKQMTSVVFDEWFRNQLLPNIPRNSVIVMDNAPYHSRQIEKMPTQTWKKEIKQWLITKGAKPGDELLKSQLIGLVPPGDTSIKKRAYRLLPRRWFGKKVSSQ